MRVEIDDKSGFCFGVVRAIDKAERALADYGTVYSLGDIVHNRIEVQRLEGLGLHTVTHADLDGLGGRRLFIRAHGEPPSTFARAREAGVEVIDATCPVVAKLQERVVKAHAEMAESGGQVVILGKRGHAEVVGLTGQVAAPTLVVEREEDLAQVDFTRPVYFLSQTTQSIALFERLADEMRRRAADAPPLHVLKSRPAGRGIELLVEKVRRVLVQRQHTRAFLAFLVVFLLRHLHTRAAGKKLHRVAEAEVFYLHYEIYDSAALAAAEAMVYLLVRGDGERRRFLTVERAEAEHVRPALLAQPHIAGHDVHYVVALHKLGEKAFGKGHALTSDM